MKETCLADDMKGREQAPRMDFSPVVQSLSHFPVCIVVFPGARLWAGKGRVLSLPALLFLLIETNQLLSSDQHRFYRTLIPPVGKASSALLKLAV